MHAGAGINQHRRVESERLNAGRDLRHLGVGVLPRILLVGPKLIERPMLDALGHFMREHDSTSKELRLAQAGHLRFDM